MSTYHGFSTIDTIKKFKVTDFDLVKRDLLNHFHIRKGEKLMNPNFGTIIWNVIHDPFTEDVKSAITADIKAIAAYDPRVSIDSVVITEFARGIQVSMDLRYLDTSQVSTMILQFDNQTRTMNVR